MLKEKQSNIISGKNISVKKSKLSLSTFTSTEQLLNKKAEIESQIEKVAYQHNLMVQQLELEQNKIIEDTKLRSEDIEKRAYEEGYNQGLKNGYEDGYTDSYEKNIERAKFESEGMLQEAEFMLYGAKNALYKYIDENRKKVIELAIAMAEQVLLEKIDNEDFLNNLVEKALSEIEKRKSIIIKVNPIYEQSLLEKLDEWKFKYSLKDDVFILPYDGMEKGNAIISTESGNMITGIDSIFEKIKSELL